MDLKRIAFLEKPAYIFDLDGVLVDTAVFHYQAWKILSWGSVEKIG